MSEARAADKPPLQIGLLLDEISQPAWVNKLIEQIADDPRFHLRAVVMNGATAEPAVQTVKRSLPARIGNLWANRTMLPYALYTKLDRRRYLHAADPEIMSSAAPLLEGVEKLTVLPRMTRHCDYFEEPDLHQIEGLDLDVALRFGFRILKGEALDIAKYGIWSFHHGDNAVNRGGPAGFWEVMRREPVSAATLQIITEKLDAGVVLGKSFSSTNAMSVTSNRQNLYWQACTLLVAKLGELYLKREELVDEAKLTPEWGGYDRPLFVAPRAWEMSKLAAGIVTRLVKSKVQSILSSEQWILAYRYDPASNGSHSEPEGAMHRFKELVPPADRFWADPMPVVANGKKYVFLEELLYSSGRGHISVLEFDEKGRPVGAPRKVLERPYHLSYPFVFEWKGEWYMMPETLRNRTVELYRAERFPDEWVFDRTVLSDVAAVDATVCEIDGRWWMFVGKSSPGATEAGLLELYHGDSPLGPWTPHAKNPVKIDVRSSRPAGPLFQVGGKWYRPAQCGAPGYGSSLVMNRIDRLDLEAFVETPVSKILPEWRPNLTGVHTIAAAGGLTLIDARQRRSRMLGGQ